MKLTGPLAPGAVIGILGGGQLARMLALAAARLGLSCHIYAPEPESPAFDVARHTRGDYEDAAALENFLADVAVATYEFENVPAELADAVAARVPLAPSALALATAQDRLAEKHFIAELDIEVAPFAEVAARADLVAALERIGCPAILKTRRMGYDGKGQVRIAAAIEAERAWEAIGKRPAILEGFIAYACEVSVIAARGWDGSSVVYDVTTNEHENGILRKSFVPAPIGAGALDRAKEIATRIAAALDYVGVLAVEMFVVEGEALIVNEIAPRVHNSGHWTIDACRVSQFEQHIRAIAGWPLGEPARHSDAIMTNLLGDEINQWPTLAAEPGTALHLYGKRETRPGRKMGHVTRLTPRQA